MHSVSPVTSGSSITLTMGNKVKATLLLIVVLLDLLSMEVASFGVSLPLPGGRVRAGKRNVSYLPHLFNQETLCSHAVILAFYFKLFWCIL